MSTRRSSGMWTTYAAMCSTGPRRPRRDSAYRPRRLTGSPSSGRDDRAAALRAAGDPRYTNYAQPDEPRFLDMTRLVSVQTRPVRLTGAGRPPRPGGASALLLIVRQPALSRDAFAESCEQRWRRALDAMPGAREDCVLHLADPVLVTSRRRSMRSSSARGETRRRDAPGRTRSSSTTGGTVGGPARSRLTPTS